LAALLVEVGVPGEEAQTIADAIVDWRTEPRTSRPIDAKLAAYRAAGLDHGPPGEDFESIDELGRVMGVTPAMLDAIKPHMSVYTEDGPDPRRADAVVARAVQRLTAESGQLPFQAAVAPNAPFSGAAGIVADVATANGGHFARYAVMKIKPGLANGYTILYWDREPAE
jgi:general secretion pathway protein K